MEIKINEEYTITSDEHNIMLVRTKIRGEDSKKPGEQYTYTLGYYASLQQALKALQRYSILGSGATSFEELLAEIEGINSVIRMALGEE